MQNLKEFRATLMSELMRDPTTIPQEILDALYAHPGKATADGLSNPFLIGADPEFMVLRPGPGLEAAQMCELYASHMGLRTGVAFGSDLSGRQVELRPRASRSTLSVVASLQVTLRWFGYWLNTAQSLSNGSYSFVSTPFFNNDGLGGHIHFGRRRKKQQRIETDALNRLYVHLLKTGAFDEEGCSLRSTITPYGRLSDIRQQKHGYEYRTYPTWISSPAQAMFVLTLAKLAVLEPWIVSQYCGEPMALFKLLAQWYTIRRDRDAMILRDMLNSLPMEAWKARGTFGAAWGLNEDIRATVKPQYYPTTIIPTQADEEETKRAIFGTPPTSVLTPSWIPATLPSGWHLVEPASLAMGELVNGLAAPVVVKVSKQGDGRPIVKIGKKLVPYMIKKLGANWNEKIKKKYQYSVTTMTAESPNLILLGPMGQQGRENMRAFLCYILPIVSVDHLREPKVTETPTEVLLYTSGEESSSNV